MVSFGKLQEDFKERSDRNQAWKTEMNADKGSVIKFWESGMGLIEIEDRNDAIKVLGKK